MQYKSNQLNNKIVPMQFCTGTNIQQSFTANLGGHNIGQDSEGCSMFMSKACSDIKNVEEQKFCNMARSNTDNETPI